jgi:hypothetical protein
MPFMVYTRNLSFGQDIPRPNLELEKFVLSMDIIDSSRRRPIALSHAILPSQIRRLRESLGRPVVIKNFGSGIGLDVLNVLTYTDGVVSKVLNHDLFYHCPNF